MVDAAQLRIVFNVNGVSFVMPIANLLAIRGKGEDALTAMEQPGSPLQLGFMVYRETDVAVYTLTSLFELPETDSDVESQLLVFTGADCPWAVQVDHVTGVMDSAQLKYQDVPVYLFREGGMPYHQVALYADQLLVSISAEDLGQAWHRSP
jgi:chemotaxis signal transduction protein